MAYPVCEVFLMASPLLAPSEDLPAETGAMVDFWGVVRGTEDGDKITGIEYEAHSAMAEHQLRLIAEEAVKAHGLKKIVILHRIGFVANGEASLLVRVGAAHREAAFSAAESVVNELKKRAPIWKHPQFEAKRSPRSSESKREAELAVSETSR